MGEMKKFTDRIPTFILSVVVVALVDDAFSVSHNQHNNMQRFLIGKPPPIQQFFHEQGIYFEGDILLPPAAKPGHKSALWENGVIPIVMDHRIGPFERKAIREAMDDIEFKTCITFPPYRSPLHGMDYLWITNFHPGGCFSFVGKVKKGPQQLNLGFGCLHKTTIIHELVHAIGFWHEQTRPDRDDWIDVHWDNIPKYHWREFQHYPRAYNFRTVYDFRSVMHFSRFAFAKVGSGPTITRKSQFIFPSALLGTGDSQGGLTTFDALQINMMYNCQKPNVLINI